MTAAGKTKARGRSRQSFARSHAARERPGPAARQRQGVSFFEQRPLAAKRIDLLHLALATSRFGRLGGLAFALLKPINRPPLPALRHSRSRKQPLGFIAITGVDAKYVSDGETMSRPLDYPDLITRPHATLDD